MGRRKLRRDGEKGGEEAENEEGRWEKGRQDSVYEYVENELKYLLHLFLCIKNDCFCT